jgi:hypothetical protein
VIKRLRTARPDKTFTTSRARASTARTLPSWAHGPAPNRDARDDHIVVQPEDRDADDWMRTVEKIARAGSVHLA